MTKIIYPELSYQIQGALFDTYNELRSFNLSEDGWETALMVTLKERNLRAERQIEYQLFYRDICVGKFYLDIIVEKKILLELKNKNNLIASDRAQTLTYLKMSDLELGILVNFGTYKLEYKRYPNYFNEQQANISPPTESQIDGSLLYPDLIYQIRAALYQVQDELGPGYMPVSYRRAVMIELHILGLSFERNNHILVNYHGYEIERCPAWFLMIDEKVLLSVVAVHEIDSRMKQALHYYLDYCGIQLGMIANFNAYPVQIVTIRCKQ